MMELSFFWRLLSISFFCVLVRYSNGHFYNDDVRCTGNKTITRAELARNGRCVPFTLELRPTPCDELYTPGVDTIYLPNNRARANFFLLSDFAADTKFSIDVLPEACRDTARKFLCYYYFPPCVVNATHFEPPVPICKDTCNYAIDVVCPTEFQRLRLHADGISGFLALYRLQFPNCSNPDFPFEPLESDCCSDAGTQMSVTFSLARDHYTVNEKDQYVEVCVNLLEGKIRRQISLQFNTYEDTADDGTDYMGIDNTLLFDVGIARMCINITIIEDMVYEFENKTFGVSITSTDPVVGFTATNATVLVINSDLFVGPVPVVTIATSVASGLVVLIIVVAALTLIGAYIKVRRSHTPLKIVFEEPTLRGITNPDISITEDGSGTHSIRYINQSGGGLLNPSQYHLAKDQRMAKVSSGFLRQMSDEKLLIPASCIRLMDCIGQGEFGVVYRAHLSSYEGRSEPGLVAVKTLKDLNDLAEECAKMTMFDHRNVLHLIGVCIDAGESPYLVMPFMEVGSLLSYLRKERAQLTIVDGAEEDLVIETQRKLLSMCLQISSGMSYLASKKFVHRDLAARNCMIDSNFVIKVADFGLSEDIYVRNYFRQSHMKKDDGGEKNDSEGVKLPIRWMALESLQDGVFTEKTDMWAFGVTCWEVFSLGRSPYPAVDPFTLVKFLEQGKRLDRPSNAACSEKVYELIESCWLESPDKRPAFAELTLSITGMLEGISGYLDFTAQSGTKTQKGYDHLEQYDQLKRYDQLEPKNEAP